MSSSGVFLCLDRGVLFGIWSIVICRWLVNKCLCLCMIWWNSGAVWIVWPLVSVCPADGVTKRYSIWINPIKKCTSNEMWRIIAGSAYGCIRRGYCFVAQFSAAKFTYGYFRNYFRGRIFTPSKREWVRATPLQHGSTWCGFKGSVVKVRVDELLSKWLRLEKLSS